MQDDLSRAQHYRALASQMRDAAETEADGKRRQELLEIANQYEHLADKLVTHHVSREDP
jgi:pyruvate-formate lyase